jgi:nitric oxide reductase NorE protein
MSALPDTERALTPAPTAASPAVATVQALSTRHVPGEAGIWIFILGDMALYAALFASFMVDRSRDVETFNRSAATLHTTIGAINTLLLLTSSLFVALGVRAVRERIVAHRAPLLFAGAFLCGVGFVANKYVEYGALVHDGLVPVTNAFFTYYFVLTGIHLTHVLAGMCVLVYLWRVSSISRAGATDHRGLVRGVENGASFWHVVDLLWVVLFPLLYLVR